MTWSGSLFKIVSMNKKKSYLFVDFLFFLFLDKKFSIREEILKKYRLFH